MIDIQPFVVKAATEKTPYSRVMASERSNRLRYEFGVAFLVVRMCGLGHDDP